MMTTGAPAREVEQFMEQFDRVQSHLAEVSPAWLMDVRREAIAEFASKGLPNAKVEAWRQTSVAAIKSTIFSASHAAELSGDEKQFLEQHMILSADEAIRVVMINGKVDPTLSSASLCTDSVQVMPLAEVLRDEPSLLQPYLGKIARIDDSPFTALNTALFEDGLVVWIKGAKLIERPIYLVHMTSSAEQTVAVHPRVLVVAESGVETKVLEHFLGLDGQTYLTNHVTEIYAGKNTILQHYKLQEESVDAFHIGTVRMRQEADSDVKNFSLAFGAKIARTDVIAELAGTGADCTLNGLYLGQDTQHIDHHTRLEHVQPHCHSTEVYKGILDQKSTAVFVGLIHVHPDAQKTDAVQSSKCVLMSPEAHVNSQPQLRIYADDVKCTHGAAIGQLDEEAIFYLRSRGIDEASARGLLTYAFANDIIDRIRIEPLRQYLTDMVSQRFDATEYAGLE